MLPNLVKYVGSIAKDYNAKWGLPVRLQKWHIAASVLFFFSKFRYKLDCFLQWWRNKLPLNFYPILLIGLRVLTFSWRKPEYKEKTHLVGDHHAILHTTSKSNPYTTSQLWPWQFWQWHGWQFTFYLIKLLVCNHRPLSLC